MHANMLTLEEDVKIYREFYIASRAFLDNDFMEKAFRPVWCASL
jgi:hypothetical protein